MRVSHSLTGMYIQGTEIPGTRVFSGMPSEPKKDHPHSSLMLCVISSSVGFLKWSCPSEPSVSVVNTTMFRICLVDFGLPHVPPKKIRLLEKSPGPPFIPAATFARPSADINAKKIPAPGRVNYRPARKYPMKNRKRLEPTRRGETWHGATTGTLTDHGTTWRNLCGDGQQKHRRAWQERKAHRHPWWIGSCRDHQKNVGPRTPHKPWWKPWWMGMKSLVLGTLNGVLDFKRMGLGM